MDARYLKEEEEHMKVRHWSETKQRETGDSVPSDRVMTGYAFVSFKQNDLQELKDIWNQWSSKTKQMFRDNYGDIAYLLNVLVNQSLLRALLQFWNPGFCCFTFNGEDMMPTVEEYMALLNWKDVKTNWVYMKPMKSQNYQAKLIKIAGMSADWANGLIQKRGDGYAFAWESIRDVIYTHPDEKIRVDLLALGIYGLVIFPKVLGNIEVHVLDLFERLKLQTNPVPAILTETFRSLNACRRHEEGRFRGCAQMLLVWFRSHFWSPPISILPGILSSTFSPILEFLAKEWREDLSKAKWMAILRDLQESDIVWRVPWLGRADHFLYKCGDYNWLMMIGVYGGIGCAPLLVSRQFGSRQFVPVTVGLRESEFEFKDDFKKKVQTINDAWKHCYRVKVMHKEDSKFTPDYDLWRHKRVNNHIPESTQGPSMTLEEHMRIIPSEADILRDELEKLRIKMEAQQVKYTDDLYQLSLDVDSREGKIKQLMKENDSLTAKIALYQADSLKLASAKNADLRKSLIIEKERENCLKIIEQEREKNKQVLEQEREKNRLKIASQKKSFQQVIIQEKEKLRQQKGKGKHVLEENQDNVWKRKVQEYKNRQQKMQSSYNTIFEELNQSQAENAELKARLTKLSQSFQEYRHRNGFSELQDSEYENETLRAQIQALEATVRDYEGQISVFEEASIGGDNYWLRRLRDATRMIQDRDDFHTDLMVQVQRVAQHVKTLANEAKELCPFITSDMEQASRILKLFKAVQELGTRAEAYL